MKVTKRKVGARWVVTQEWPRLTRFQTIETEFPTEAQADEWIEEVETLVESVGVKADWRAANDYTKELVNQTVGSSL